MKRTLNTTINRSKNEKNDEHYTQLSVIEDEVRRNVCRWERMQTVTNFYDGWNLVREVEVRGIITNIIEYVWGKDLSGTFQGAGGVGGLLYERRDGAIYIQYCISYN